MKRYRYDPGMLRVTATAWSATLDDDIIEESEDIYGFKVFDAQVGTVDAAYIAFTRDRDTAQRLVYLLNEEEKTPA